MGRDEMIRREMRKCRLDARGKSSQSWRIPAASTSAAAVDRRGKEEGRLRRREEEEDAWFEEEMEDEEEEDAFGVEAPLLEDALSEVDDDDELARRSDGTETGARKIGDLVRSTRRERPD